MATLILIRHGQSTWNAANRFTGWVDVPLSKQGREEARRAAQQISNYRVDVCYTSLLIRAIETAIIALTECEGVCGDRSPVLKHNADDPDWHGWDAYEGDPSQELPIFLSAALDERYYGELQGLNKSQTAAKYGSEVVHTWRRSFATRPPGGESLADTAARTLPFFQSRILSHIAQDEVVLVAAHGNSLRSIIMHLDQLDPETVPDLELATGVPIVYEMTPDAQILSKRTL